MDGVAMLTQPAIAPAASFEYRFRPPDAGTFWYRAQTASQLDRGLLGAFIVAEDRPVDVDRDIVLVLAATGAAPILVNGSMRPDILVSRGERLRLRLINATSSRGMALKLEGHGIWVMAIDGQPAEPFVARDSRIGLAPGSRIDLFVDMLRDPGSVAALIATGANEHVVARLVYQGDSGARVAARREPTPLPANPLPAQIDLRNAQRVELPLTARRLDPGGAPLFTVRRGRPVTLAIRKSAGPPQVLHLHGHHVRHLDRLDDGWKPYWLDTLVVGDQVERIAFVADNPGKWLIESRVLDQPESTAAVWFAVT
jgi:FtsP/CotA-like multicopper oxidase with cupredoxin domain